MARLEELFENNKRINTASWTLIDSVGLDYVKKMLQLKKQNKTDKCSRDG